MEIEWILTGPDEIKGSVKIVLVYVAHHRHFLVANLFIGPKDDQKKPAARSLSAAMMVY
jgi:hypothetical protein